MGSRVLLRPLCCLCCLLISLAPASSARTSARTSARPSARPSTHPAKSRVHSVDPWYSSALAAANQFLHAWQAQDHESGIMMLSDAARERASADRLQDFFTPSAGAAYEIQHGRRVKSGAYEFPVVLFGESETSSRPHACTLVILRSGKNDWAVDRLP
jgi:hypothetical protein